MLRLLPLFLVFGGVLVADLIFLVYARRRWVEQIRLLESERDLYALRARSAERLFELKLPIRDNPDQALSDVAEHGIGAWSKEKVGLS